MEKDEQLGALMAGFRGSNLDAADFAREDTSMSFVDVDADADEQLPQEYDPAAISAYWWVLCFGGAGQVVVFVWGGGCH
jgi:hypothetical protein